MGKISQWTKYSQWAKCPNNPKLYTTFIYLRTCFVSSCYLILPLHCSIEKIHSQKLWEIFLVIFREIQFSSFRKPFRFPLSITALNVSHIHIKLSTIDCYSLLKFFLLLLAFLFFRQIELFTCIITCKILQSV